MNKEWAFIINPVSGNGAAKTVVPILQEKIQTSKIQAELFYTERPGHAAEIARACAEKNFKYLIAVGGDGTLNEMTRFLFDKKDVTIGIIPAGTGNDFIQILGFSESFGESDWEVFFTRKTIELDVGFVNDFHFLNGMGLGFDAEVAAQNYDKNEKVKQGGKNKYVWHILKTLFFFRERNMSVFSNDAKSDTECFINTIGVGRRFAGGFYLTPKAIANDGLLDICMIQRLSLLQRLRMLLKVPKGNHILDEKVNYYQTDKLALEFQKKVAFHVDGELHFARRFDVSIKPAVLKIIYNPSGKHFFKP
jgi:YegS/Rv2252/BmrU family lipid kinase